MVYFALCVSKVNDSKQVMAGDYINKDDSYDVLDELMGLDGKYSHDHTNDLSSRSVDIEEILEQFSRNATNGKTKTEIGYDNINYKDALLNSLFAQVEYLKQDALKKNDIIEALMTNFKTCNNPNEVSSSDITSETDEYINNNDIDNNNDNNHNNNNSYTDHITHSNFEIQHDVSTISATNESFQRILGERDDIDELYENINSDSEWSDDSYNVSTPVNAASNIIPSIYTKPLEDDARWKSGTTLIIGDSILNGIDETRLKNTKVRIYRGASVDDMFYNVFPLLRKAPTNIIIHAGTNTARTENSSDIAGKLLDLKYFILSWLPHCNVIISGLVNRYDNGKAQLTVERTNERLINTGIQIIDNSNIERIHLGRKGHHLNPHGTGKLAMNFIKVLKTL